MHHFINFYMKENECTEKAAQEISGHKEGWETEEFVYHTGISQLEQHGLSFPPRTCPIFLVI